jgi:phosphoglycolate phosphatase-like HAD superfamily hydrolase
LPPCSRRCFGVRTRTSPRSRTQAPTGRGGSEPREQSRGYKRHAPTEARDRALAALRANPDRAPTEIAKIAKVSRATVVNAREQLAKEAHKAARSTTAKPDRRHRAQRFLRDELADGPKCVTDVEEAAERAHVDLGSLEQARADLGIVTSRGNAGGVQAVQWSLPG